MWMLCEWVMNGLESTDIFNFSGVSKEDGVVGVITLIFIHDTCISSVISNTFADWAAYTHRWIKFLIIAN